MTAAAGVWVTNTRWNREQPALRQGHSSSSRQHGNQCSRLPKSRGGLCLAKALPRKSREIIELLPSSPCPQPGAESSSTPLPGVYSSRDSQACVVQLPAQQQFHVEWSKPVPREINNFSAFLPATLQRSCQISLP